ncbi:MAG TPA: hypothetical protein VEZ13_09830 [Brevibacillus sp.]|nr:hypothetical protein [Brevibacillus sp.]
MNPSPFIVFLLLLMTTGIVYGCQSSGSSHTASSVELSLDTGTLSIPVKELPELEDFLASFDPSDRQIEWERVNTSAFSSPTGVVYGDIRYSCGTKLCDHLWLQIKEEQRNTLSLPAYDGSLFVSHAFSPDETYLALLLGRNEGTELVRHQLLVLRTDEFSVAAVHGEPATISEQAVSGDFAFPILDLQWKDDQTLEATVPDTADLSYEGLQQWRDQGSKTRTLLLQVS